MELKYFLYLKIDWIKLINKYQNYLLIKYFKF